MAYSSPFEIGNVNSFLQKKIGGSQTPQYQAPAAVTPAPPPPPPQQTPTASPSATSPARAAYVNDLSSKFGNVGGTIYNKGTGQGYSSPDQFFKDAGVSSFGNLKFDTQYSPQQQQAAAPAGAGQVNSQIAYTQPVTGDTAASKTPAKNAYIDYLQKLFNPDALSGAQGNLNELNKRTSEELLRARGDEDTIRGNQIGQVENGVNYSLNENARQSNRSLADLALSKGYQQDYVNQLLGAGQELYGYEQADQEKAQTRADSAKQFAFDNNISTPFYNQGGTVYRTSDQKGFATPDEAFAAGVSKDFSNAPVIKKPKAPVELSEGASLVDPETGEVIYKNPKTYAPGSGTTGLGGLYTDPTTGQVTLSPLAQAVQNGTIAIDKLSVKQRDAVAAELAAFGQQSGRQQALASNLDLVNSLLDSGKLGQISGIPDLRSFIPGTAAQLVKNQFNQLKSSLSLDNREKLKGSGAISDFEFKVLSDAASAIGRNLSDADLRSQLEKVRDVFAGKYATTTSGSSSGGVTVQAPDGKFYTFPDQAAANAFKKQIGL